MELMIKREAEKETQEDLKQVFRVFDKVSFLDCKFDLQHKIQFRHQDGNGFVSTSEIKFVLSK